MKPLKNRHEEDAFEWIQGLPGGCNAIRESLNHLKQPDFKIPLEDGVFCQIECKAPTRSGSWGEPDPNGESSHVRLSNQPSVEGRWLRGAINESTQQMNWRHGPTMLLLPEVSEGDMWFTPDGIHEAFTGVVAVRFPAATPVTDLKGKGTSRPEVNEGLSAIGLMESGSKRVTIYRNPQAKVIWPEDMACPGDEMYEADESGFEWKPVGTGH